VLRICDDDRGRIGVAEKKVTKSRRDRNAPFVVDVVFKPSAKHV